MQILKQIFKNKNLSQPMGYFLLFMAFFLAYSTGEEKFLEKIYRNLYNEVTNKLEYILLTKNQVKNIYLIGKYTVTKVIDGDTFYVQDEDLQKDVVRILAVNSLEMKEIDPKKLCFAKKQTQFTKDYLFEKDVWLYGDSTQPKRDKYNRLLAYVATSSENFISIEESYFFNDYLVDTGNGNVYKAHPPAILYPRLKTRVEKAKLDKLGMWSNLCG